MTVREAGLAGATGAKRLPLPTAHDNPARMNPSATNAI